MSGSFVLSKRNLLDKRVLRRAWTEPSDGEPANSPEQDYMRLLIASQARANVRFGSLGDIASCLHHVRFAPESGRP